MTIKTNLLKIGTLALLLIFLLITAAGCEPKPINTPIQTPTVGSEMTATLTPVPETPPTPTLTLTPSPTPDPVFPNSVITLPDGSSIILKPETRIEILQLPGIPAESVEILVKILQGEIMVVPNSDSSFLFNVQNSSGITARYQGCAMVVEVDNQNNTFEINCIDGVCNVALTPDNLFSLTSNFAWVIQNGSILDQPDAIDFAELSKDYAEDMPACAMDASILPNPQTAGQASTPTPDFAATATCACADFQQQFPLTPCP